MLSDYDYNLPEELIAQEPLLDRASSRLLWLHNSKYKGGEGENNTQGTQNGTLSPVSHHRFSDIVDILQPNDLLIMNDTRVTAMRLMGRKGIFPTYFSHNLFNFFTFLFLFSLTNHLCSILTCILETGAKVEALLLQERKFIVLLFFCFA